MSSFSWISSCFISSISFDFHFASLTPPALRNASHFRFFFCALSFCAKSINPTANCTTHWVLTSFWQKSRRKTANTSCILVYRVWCNERRRRRLYEQTKSKSCNWIEGRSFLVRMQCLPSSTVPLLAVGCCRYYPSSSMKVKIVRVNRCNAQRRYHSIEMDRQRHRHCCRYRRHHNSKTSTMFETRNSKLLYLGVDSKLNRPHSLCESTASNRTTSTLSQALGKIVQIQHICECQGDDRSNKK